MARIRLKYVNAVRKDSGRIHFYFRRAGSKRMPLPGLPGSAEFMDAYAIALNAPQARLDIGAGRTVPGTVNAVIAAFYNDYRFTKNKPISRQTDRNILEAFRERHGAKRIALLEKRHIMAMIGEKSGKPAAQRNLLRVLRVLLAFAVDQGLRADNSALGIKLKITKTVGFHSWTEDELRQFEQRHPIGSKARLAFALLLWTAQRRSDVVRLGPPNIVSRDGGQCLQFKQSKTDTEIDIPLAPPLAEIIAATPMVGVKTFLATDYGKQFTPAGFGNWFRDRCDEAGLQHCTAHGMRKAFLRRGAELGWSEDYLASFSGHRDTRELRTYVRAASKARMANKAMASMLLAFPKNNGETA
jgi:integrase